MYDKLKIMNFRYYKTTINSILKLYNYSFNFFTLYLLIILFLSIFFNTSSKNNISNFVKCFFYKNKNRIKH